MTADGDQGESAATDPEGGVPLELIPLHSTNLLTVLDETGTIRYESPSIERIYGFEPEELVGEQVVEYFHPEDRQRVMEAFQAITTSEEYRVKSVEYRHERADGTYMWVESVGATNPTPEGNYVINTRDISERKERERTLEETNDRLSEFASVVTHDLRNPLTVAQGYLKLAESEAPNEHHETIEAALDRMERLIADLLWIARNGERVEDSEPVDLATLSRSCWEHVDTADASLIVEVDRRVRGDHNRLMQLLENLIRNAVEHGEGDVTVSIGELDDSEGFYVADDGPGIEQDRRGRVFEGGYSTATNGTGLGLHIVSDVADTHGWAVDVTESDDGGARFEISEVTFEP